MNNYTTYHLHTELSLLDSCTNYKLYVEKAKELGQKAMCFSEHGNIYSWIEKKICVNNAGMKYIHGCEVYLTETLDEKIRDNYHTILIAKNYDGFKELNLLIDKSTQSDHFYYKPRISFDEFLSISDNIISTSACLSSPLNKYSGDRYEELCRKYTYYEVQPYNCEDQIAFNKKLVKLSERFNKPLIAGTDTHSIDNYKAECRSILQRAKKIQFFDEYEVDLTYKSYDELVKMFELQNSLNSDQYLSAIENTNIMADSVEDFELDTSFKYPVLCDDEEQVLKQRINDMYKDKIKRGVIKPDPRYKEMVNEEMRVFKKIGMIGFMLFMSKLVCWCWDNGIPTGFCRGSVGGSMIAYLTDIIDVNPLTWGTMFSRFANEDRKEIGDIDIDLAPTQRHLVYEHIIEEYGADNTAYVLAIGTIADKGCIDDIARALADEGGEMSEKYSLQNTKLIKSLYEEDPDRAKAEYPELFRYFDGLVGTAVSQSMHPAGIIVSPVTLPDNYGTFWSDGKRILFINMEEIHDISLVKYDLLGLKNIEIIKDCCELAWIPYPKSHEINWEDSNVWDHITDSPVGIFQMESKFAYDSMKKMGCRSVDDMSLVNASIRPSGESYRDRLLAGEWNKNPSELIDNELKASRGFLAYQEQVISFLQNVCGLSGSEADNVRRAIGRKQMDRLQAALPQILEGYCGKSDKPREEAEQEAKTFLKIIEDSSNYMFGRNHSTGYSMIGYTCGYLRYYYPVEFVTAYLNNANNDEDIQMGTQLAKDMGIKLIGAKFRHSRSKYTCDREARSIYKGVSSIKHLNDRAAEDLYSLKDNSYNSFIDLLTDIYENCSVDSRQLEILIKINFFSEFGYSEQLLDQVKKFNILYNKKQLSLSKLDSIGIPRFLVEKYSSKITDKTAKDFSWKDLIVAWVNYSEPPKRNPDQHLKWELELLGYIQTKYPNINHNCYMLIDERGETSKYFTLYQIKTGKTIQIKCRKKVWSKNPINIGSTIRVNKIEESLRWKKDNNGDWYQSEEKEELLTDYNIIT